MGAVDLVIQVESPKSVTAGLQRIGRAGPRRRRGLAAAGSSPSSAPTCSSARWSSSGCATATIEATVVPRNPLDVLAQQIVAMAPTGDDWNVPRAARAGPARLPVRRAVARAARQRARHARRPLPVRGVRRAAAADRLGPRARTRSARARARCSWRSPTPARSPTAASTACTCPTAGAWASWTRRWSTRRARARRSCSAPRPGASRRSRATG